MSISDMIVVMKEGVVQQTGRPQEVYDSPVNLFVAKFLGTPPINVFTGRVKENQLYIGDEAVLEVKGVKEQEVYAAIRPEGFMMQENGPFSCRLSTVEVMGRDISVVSSNQASLNPAVRSIVSAECRVESEQELVRFALMPHKVFLFDKETEERIYFETGSRQQG